MNKRLTKEINSGNASYFYTSWTWRKKREQIIERDNNECQICKGKGRVTVGTRDNPLHVHHIKHLKKRVDLALDDENLITVCKPCHEGEHPEIYKKETNNVEEMFPERWE